MDFKLSIIFAFGVLILAWEVYAAVDCSVNGVGRFPVPGDKTCKNYTLCVYNNKNNSYLAYNYTCPTSSVFNPNTAKCTASSNYVCNVTDTCTADGFVPKPSSTNCASYIECVEIDGGFIETIYTCPDNTFFNPSTTLCESDYICTTKTNFECTAAGRFANTSDTTCKTYFFCVYANNDKYIQYNYTCPNNSVFSPTSKVCTTLYNCGG